MMRYVKILLEFDEYDFAADFGIGGFTKEQLLNLIPDEGKFDGHRKRVEEFYDKWNKPSEFFRKLNEILNTYNCRLDWENPRRSKFPNLSVNIIGADTDVIFFMEFRFYSNLDIQVRAQIKKDSYNPSASVIYTRENNTFWWQSVSHRQPNFHEAILDTVKMICQGRVKWNPNKPRPHSELYTKTDYFLVDGKVNEFGKVKLMESVDETDELYDLAGQFGIGKVYPMEKHLKEPGHLPNLRTKGLLAAKDGLRFLKRKKRVRQNDLRRYLWARINWIPERKLIYSYYDRETGRRKTYDKPIPNEKWKPLKDQYKDQVAKIKRGEWQRYGDINYVSQNNLQTIERWLLHQPGVRVEKESRNNFWTYEKKEVKKFFRK